MKRARIIFPAMAAIVLVAVAVFVVQLTRPPLLHPEIGIQVAHAQIGDPGKGCSKCHNTPIVATCSTCHTSPPTQIRGIAFPHHDPAPGPAIKDCTFALCHGSAGNDARFVKVLKASMSFCGQCHKITHSQ